MSEFVSTYKSLYAVPLASLLTALTKTAKVDMIMHHLVVRMHL